MPLNVDLVRQQFPSLNRLAIFLDNPAGTQISKQSLDRINSYLLEHNANHEGMFETSRRSDEVLHQAHAGMADFLPLGPNRSWDMPVPQGKTFAPGELPEPLVETKRMRDPDPDRKGERGEDDGRANVLGPPGATFEPERVQQKRRAEEQREITNQDVPIARTSHRAW